MVLKEIKAKTILSKSQIYDYALNPYVGCLHNCVYCYAKFMKRFTGHHEQWGEFVDIKIKAAELLIREVDHGSPDFFSPTLQEAGFLLCSFGPILTCSYA